MIYLDSAKVASILSQPDRSSPEGQRDHALLSLLYNTGVSNSRGLKLASSRPLSEIAGPRSPDRERPKRTHLPIWPETAELLTTLIERNGRRPDERLFINRYGTPLSASGFRFRLRQYVRGATVKQPTLSQKRITPHVFRHTIAVHLVAAGVDATVIRSWLGHAHLDTANHYAQADLETKRKALEQVDPSLRSSKPPRWKRDADLLTWLDSL
jgi:site-specific recombinase XerD